MEKNNSSRMTEFLKKYADNLGFNLTEMQLHQFLIYYEALEEYNKVMNLTAVTGPEEVAVRHFLDSSAPLFCLKTKESYSEIGIKILDIGTGAGFPGMPLAILLPDSKVTLADTLKKRTGFLEVVREKTGVDNVEILTGRAEDLAREEPLRESFDIVVSRAVAELPVLCEYCLPFVRKGGMFMAWKGPAAEEEKEKAENAIKILGGGKTEMQTYRLPETDAVRYLIIIKKEEITPEKYPRRAGIPTKRPL